MKKVLSLTILAIIVLVGPALSADDHEYHFIIWCRDADYTKYWYVAVGARYDVNMSSWVLTDAARLDGDRIVRLLKVIVHRELLISVEHVGSIRPEDLIF